MKTFCTAVNCMDGRVQVPVLTYLLRRFQAEYVDSITEPGPNRILAERDDAGAVQSILDRLKISVENHASVGIALAGHHDCCGNPACKDDQMGHLAAAVRYLRGLFQNIPVIALWVDENWNVIELSEL